MITLADLFEVERLTRGRIASALEATRDDIMQWCRSGAAGSVPPQLMAAELLAALPDALSVPLRHLVARQVTLGKAASGDAVVTLLNRPRLLVFAHDGALRFDIKLSADICLTRRPALAADGSGSDVPDIWSCSGNLAMIQDNSSNISIVSQIKSKDIPIFT